MLLSKTITIDKIETYYLHLPLTHSFSTGFGTIEDKSTLLVKIISSDGIIGWGEGATLPYPMYKADATDEIAYLALNNYIIPAVIGKTISHPSEILNFYSHIRGFTFSKTAIETALWMIYSLLYEKPIASLIGGNQKRIPVGESIGIKPSIKEVLEEIEVRLREGYQRTKIKIKPNWDIKVVQAVRKEFGNIDLMVDANSSYTLKDISVFKELDQYGLVMLEQPLGDDDIIDHSILQRQINTPICLDESIISVEDARKAIKIDACRIINIKPSRVGGITSSIQIHDLCKEKGVGVWCGGLLETGIGRAYNIALSSLSNFIYPADMSPNHFYYEHDLINPTYSVSNEGFIDVPQINGLGYEIDEKRIRKHTIDKKTYLRKSNSNN